MICDRLCLLRYLSNIYIHMWSESAWIKDIQQNWKGSFAENRIPIPLVDHSSHHFPPEFHFSEGINPWWPKNFEIPRPIHKKCGKLWALWAPISQFIDVHWVCLSLCCTVLFHSLNVVYMLSWKFMIGSESLSTNQQHLSTRSFGNCPHVFWVSATGRTMEVS